MGPPRGPSPSRYQGFDPTVILPANSRPGGVWPELGEDGASWEGESAVPDVPDEFVSRIESAGEPEPDRDLAHSARTHPGVAGEPTQARRPAGPISVWIIPRSMSGRPSGRR